MRIIALIVLFSITSNLYSQICDNRISVSIGGSYDRMVSKNYTTTENLILPSLYAGFRNSASFNISGYYRMAENIYCGLGFSTSRYKNWNIPDEDLYCSSEINKKDIKINIRLINPLSDNSTIKYFYYTQVGLSFGPERIILTDFMTGMTDQDEITDIETTIYSTGGSVSIGLAYRLFGTNYIFMETGYSHSRSDSELTLHDRINQLYLQTGILFILSMDKQYYY